MRDKEPSSDAPKKLVGQTPFGPYSAPSQVG